MNRSMIPRRRCTWEDGRPQSPRAPDCGEDLYFCSVCTLDRSKRSTICNTEGSAIESEGGRERGREWERVSEVGISTSLRNFSVRQLLNPQRSLKFRHGPELVRRWVSRSRKPLSGAFSLPAVLGKDVCVLLPSGCLRECFCRWITPAGGGKL